MGSSLSHRLRLSKGHTSTMGEYEAIRDVCLKRNIYYEDNEFPATAKSLFLDGPIETVEWKRPKEICAVPHFKNKDAVYHDMDQGNLGNCWFIASVACIASSPQSKLLDRIVPSDQDFDSKYCGVFHFYFWQYGIWTEVIIDDRLPTVNNKLIYCKNRQQKDEFWCPLLEKAFAKLHGSYQEINGGFMDQCLVDLTGGIGDYVALGNSISTIELTKLLTTCHQMNSVIGGAINQRRVQPNQREVLQDTGLYSGHAYTVVNVKEVYTSDGKVALLHIRNPWGKADWNGAWSDGSKEWMTLRSEDRNATTKYWNDGEFWMSVDDFRKHFTFVVMAHLTPDAYSEEIADNLKRAQWKQTHYYGSWVRGVSAGGPMNTFTSKRFWKNPQFKLKLSTAKKQTTVIISLLEINAPSIRTLGDVNIGFVVFMMRDDRQPSRITADNYFEFIPRMVNTSGGFTSHREVTGRFVMDPANHIIIPCTQKAGQQAEFFLRIFSEEDVAAEEIEDSDLDTSDVDDDKVSNPDIKLEVEFDNLAGTSGGIDAADMKTLMDSRTADGLGKTYQIETCRCLLSSAGVYSQSYLATKKQTKEAVDLLNNLVRVFSIVDRNKTKFVERTELDILFKVLDFSVSGDTIHTIMTKHGGREQRLSLEDFIQICCKFMSLEREYNAALRLSGDKLDQADIYKLSFI